MNLNLFYLCISGMNDSGENWQICVVVYVVHTGSTSMIHRPITATVEFMFNFASVKDSQRRQ